VLQWSVRPFVLRLEIAGYIPASALSSVAFGKSFSHIFPRVTKQRKLIRKQSHRATHRHWSCSFGLSLVEDHIIGVQRRPVDLIARDRHFTVHTAYRSITLQSLIHHRWTVVR